MQEEAKLIYTVTVLSGNPAVKDSMRSVCWGYYFDSETAEESIYGNWTDMSEIDYYHYAVISSLEPGVAAIPTEIQWFEFEWDHDRPAKKNGEPRHSKFIGAKKITKPEKYSQWGFGCLSK